jgi:DNA-directed RNA polymerase specialized sigma24 family protein
MEGHALSDVARLLRVPEGTVKSRLFQARRILAETLR